MIERTIAVERIEDVINVFGSFDQNLRIIEQEYDVTVFFYNPNITDKEEYEKRYNELINSKELDDILDNGRDYANYLANRKLSKVYNKVGLGRKR